MNNVGHRREHAIAACPVVDRREHRAYMAARDAQDLIMAVRDLDPREVWGTLAIWAERDPLRLFAVVTALASMVPTDQSVRDLLAWTEQLDKVPVRPVVRPRYVSHDELLRAAHAAYVRGSRDKWVVDGHREYDRLRKQRHRDRSRLANDEQEVA